MAQIDLRDVCKTLSESSGIWGGGRRSTVAIRDLTLRVPDGQTMVVLGPSGCGKTTLLKLIAGLLQPDSGDVLFNDADMKDVGPGECRIGMVFQNYALFRVPPTRRAVTRRIGGGNDRGDRQRDGAGRHFR